MAIDLNDEIVQDFLVEAGEILEQLSEQLVDLESRPDDKDLLNAVFRGFHTIKGGAGFIGLSTLVEVCHRAEDVFNLLRQGDRRVDARLMDVVLRALDVVNEMFGQVRGGIEPGEAPASLLEELGALLAAEATVEEVPTPEPAPVAAAPASDEISDDEFEALLDALGGQRPKEASTGRQAEAAEASGAAPAGDDITEDEFEALLDQIHGKGHHPGAQLEESPPPVQPKPAPAPAPVAAEPAAPPGRTGSVPAKAPGERSGSQAESTVRVDTEVLDHIMNMVGELVLARNRLVALEAVNADEHLAKAVNNLDVVTADLQSGVMRTRMQPIKKVFGRFPRVIRDLARTLNKEVVLEMEGEDTDLDKNLVEALADPLVHLVRNSVDHGIESPAVREAAGKPRQGRVVLSAEQAGDRILLTIADDGAGMDPDLLRRKAVEKGLMDEATAARLDERDCYNLIFMPGFSTKSEISDVSGRGVGMDVVKTRISQLNGSIEIDSMAGKGTTIRIKVPLTLAIVPTLMVMLGAQIFALPLVNVSEIFDLQTTMTNVVDGQLVVRVRDRPLPLFYLSHWLVSGPGSQFRGDGTHVVVVHVGTQQVGFVVDHLLGQEEVVIKPLGAMLHGTRGFAGATITGDGRIALILDVPSLVRAHGSRY